MEWFIYALLCALMIGIVTIINKKVLSHEHASQFSASRGLLTIPILLCLIPFIDLSLPLYVYLMIYITSLIASAGMLFYFKSLRHGQISVVAPMMNLSPLFLLVIAFFLIGEKPSTLQYVGVFLLIFGTYALEVGVKNKGFLEPLKAFAKAKTTHFLVISMIMFSISATFDKIILTRHTGPMTYLFIIQFFISLNFILLESYKFGFKEIVQTVKKDFKILSTASVLVFFAHIFYMLAVAIPGAAITLIIPIKRASTLFSTLFGGKMFHEDNLLVKVLACIIMIWGTVFILL